MSLPVLYLISPSAPLRQAVMEQLRPTGHYQLVEAESVQQMGAARADFILLDAALEIAAEPLLPEIVARSSPPALLFLLGAPEILRHNAAEIFPKPLRLGLVVMRLQFYLQVRHHSRNTARAFGPYRLELNEHHAVRLATGGVVPLTGKEIGLLEELLSAGAPVHRDQLLANVWGYDGRIDTHTLETHIYRLRHKLCLPDKPDIFHVEHGAYAINPDWLS